MKPELFVHGADAPISAADSLKSKVDTVANPKRDSTQVASTAKPQDRSGQPSVDTAFVSALSEKNRSLASALDSLKRVSQIAKVMSDTSSQSDWKSTAKLIETMDPEEAGKILKRMSDSEVKQVITKVKKKQAGKILANLDPDRAARILR
jgi:flagellar motility protein MotE (MotC chaperone)